MTKTPLSELDSITKKKSKKIESINGQDSPDSSSTKKIKKKRKICDDEEETSEASSELGISDVGLKMEAVHGSSSKGKIEKKRKICDDEEETSETSSELGVSDVDLKKVGNGVSKKQRLIEEESGGSSDDDEDEDGEVSADEEGEKEADPNAVSNFRISEPLRAKLKSKGIESLFPIQAMTFEIVLNGSDLVGRARTGQVLECLAWNLLVFRLNFGLFECDELGRSLSSNLLGTKFLC